MRLDILQLLPTGTSRGGIIQAGKIRGRVTLPTGDNQGLYSPISGVAKRNNRLIGSIGSIV